MIRIRAMMPADARRVLQIFGEGIATGDATFETRVPTWQAWDRGHLASPRLVAEAQDTVGALGWAALSGVSRRAVYAGVAEVSVYLAAEARGRGVGRRLLGALVEASEAAGIWTLQAGVFPENQASVRLHESLGFRRLGVRERIGYGHGRWRDVLLLERRSDVVGTG